MTNAELVTASKPKIGGAAYRAPLGTELPVSATVAINQAFKSLGHISEDGMTNANSPTFETVKAWGNEEVLHYQTERPDTFKLKLIEARNVEVHKIIYGDDNVQGDLDKGIAIKANSNEIGASCWIIDMVMKGGVAKRIVIPNGTVTQVGEIVYMNQVLGYEITISASPDKDHNTHYEYLTKTEEGAAE